MFLTLYFSIVSYSKALFIVVWFTQLKTCWRDRQDTFLFGGGPLLFTIIRHQILPSFFGKPQFSIHFVCVWVYSICSKESTFNCRALLPSWRLQARFYFQSNLPKYEKIDCLSLRKLFSNKCSWVLLETLTGHPKQIIHL